MTEQHSIRNSLMAVTLIALLIKALGLVKQMAIAACCGASAATDAFFIASGVMVTLAVMIFGGMAVPLLTEYTDVLYKACRRSANAVLTSYLRFIIPTAAVITLAVFLFADYVAVFLAPSYESAQRALLAHDIRLVAAVFVVWAYFLSVNVVLETDKNFVPGRCQALFQNLFIVVACFLFVTPSSVDSLLYAMVLSGVAESVYVTWEARRLLFPAHFAERADGKSDLPQLDDYVTDSTSATSGSTIDSTIIAVETEEGRDAGGDVQYIFKKSLHKILAASIPVVLGNAIYEINDIVDKQVASCFDAGAVSQLVYGSTINDIVVGIIVMSVSTVLLSHFSTYVAQRDFARLALVLRQSFRALTLAIAPLTLLFLFAAHDFVDLLFGRGRFTSADAAATTHVAVLYSLGFVVASYRAVLTKVFYALRDTRSPLINGVVSVSCNIALSLTLAYFIGVGGIALATTLAMCISFALYTIQLRRHLTTPCFQIRMMEWAKLIVALALTTVALCLIQRHVPMMLLRLVLDTLGAVIVYVGTLAVLKSQLLEEQWNLVRQN